MSEARLGHARLSVAKLKGARLAGADLTAAPVSIDPYVLASRNETIFEGPEIEGALSRRLRQTKGGGRKDLLGVDAHHKALAKEASRNRRCEAQADPRQILQEG
jgi:uncharacterized protein YjbI with pentapeptide repeats